MSHIVKSVAAEQDLINIWLYTYQEWGEAQAVFYSIKKPVQIFATGFFICGGRYWA